MLIFLYIFRDMYYLIIDVLKEGDAGPPVNCFDGCVITTMEFETHGTYRSKRVGANKVRIYAWLV